MTVAKPAAVTAGLEGAATMTVIKCASDAAESAPDQRVLLIESAQHPAKATNTKESKKAAQCIAAVMDAAVVQMNRKSKIKEMQLIKGIRPPRTRYR